MATCPECRQVHPDSQATCPADGTALLPDAAFAAADLDLAPGATVGEYTIERILGRGGFGTVYKAVQPLIGKHVAIKVLDRALSAKPETASRFIEEARAVNQIQHRYIIDIFSFGQLDDGRHYYVMNYLDGETLQGLLDRLHRLPCGQALPILHAVAEAVDAAHAKGIAHRDLKPDNVFITRDGTIKLLDFGIAKLMGTETQHKTATGAIMGTPLYMSPEQCRGRGVDHRTDVYAFGAMTFQLLTGKPPFYGPTAMDILVKHVTDQPPRPSSVASDLPAALDAPILAMLEKNPAARPGSLPLAIRAVEDAARRSGIEVADTLTGLVLKGVPPTTRRDKRAMADLPTLDSTEEARPVHMGSTSAFLGAETQHAGATHVTASETTRRRVVLWGSAAAVVLAVTAFVLWPRSPSRAANEATLAPKDTLAAAATQPGGGPGSEPARPAGAAAFDTPEEAPPADPVPAVEPPGPAIIPVIIDVKDTPADTRVLAADGTELGIAPGPIELARGDQPITLRFDKSGFEPAEREITPRENATLRVTLSKLSRSSRRSSREHRTSSTDKPGSQKGSELAATASSSTTDARKGDQNSAGAKTGDKKPVDSKTGDKKPTDQQPSSDDIEEAF